MTRDVDPSRIEQFVATARRLQLERHAGERVVKRLLADVPVAEYKKLADEADLQTCGALECITALAAEALSVDPQRAFALACLATQLAERIHRNLYPPVIDSQFRANALKILGKALRTLGENEAAIDAFRSADAELARHAVLAHDHAVIAFNMAVSLQELERFDDSIATMREAKQIFRDHGDTPNVTRITFAEGVLLQRLKRFREAREIYLLLMATAQNMDLADLAAIHKAVGFCSLELADVHTADVNFQRAITLFRQAGQPVEILMAEVGRGRVLIRNGEAETGINHLRSIRREFLRKGMHEEAGLCGLDVVEALLTLGRASEAESLARKIVGEFTLAKLSKRALAALGYLTEAIASRVIEPAHVHQVHDYILSLRSSPEREFVWAE